MARLDAALSGVLRRTLLAFLAAVAVATLSAGPASAWWNDQWGLRKKITIDASQTGAAINDPIQGMAVLIRLHAGNFRFAEAKEDGSDLIFIAGDDKTPLKHHIEKYDHLLNEALVWVRATELKAGEKTNIWLYHKNEKAQSAADAKATYDLNTLLVYHFAERGTPAQDASSFANHAATPGVPAEGAIIGTGLRLDGVSGLTLPAAPALAVPAAGDVTVSLWAKPDGLQRDAVLYSRREGSNHFIVGMTDGSPFVELSNNGAVQRSAPGAPVAPGGWHHIAVTASPGLVTLYLDGAAYGSLNASLPALQTAATLGADLAPAPQPAPAAAQDPNAAAAPAPVVAAPASGMAGFAGEIDELNIAKIALSAGTIRAQAIGQGLDHEKLVVFSADEETARWISGHFAIILRSVTIDGWVVIAILGVMAVLSWIVIVAKAGYLGKQRKANKRFSEWLDAKEAAGDVDPAEPADLPKGRATRDISRRSTLHRLQAIGAEQVRRRAALANGRPLTLSPQSIAAIRAAIEAEVTRESQQLNNRMTVLTISIAGGPYLGLLGTVVGVMITFAAIAESGDVNINAIAPGVAAALVATVAGLAVAIPALFAYNFLSIGIRDLSTDMHIFAEAYTTRLAEYYQAPAKPRAVAAE